MIQGMRRSRTLGWDRNPLRRRIDRAEAAMITGLIVVFLIAGPVLAVVVGHWLGSVGVRQQRAEAAWRPVSATVLSGTPPRWGSYAATAETVWVLARWTAPDGQTRLGPIPVSPPATVGSTAGVWVNRWGSLTGPPLLRSQLQARVAAATVLTPPVLGLLLCFAGHVGRALLAQRRMDAWDRAWRAVEPRWTKQL
jgi:hypothetical protein